jgi:flagellin
VGQLVSELNRIAEVTTFNGQHLLNGTMGTQYFQVGPNAGETIGANGTNFMTTTYGNYRVENTGADPEKPAVKAGGGVRLTGYKGSSPLTVTVQDSARTIVEKINNLSGDTGITATAKTMGVIKPDPGTYALNLKSNNGDPVIVSFAIGTDLTLNDSYAAAINAFNAQTAKTGVMAEFYSDNPNYGIKLTNQNGNDIQIQNTLSTTAHLYACTPAGVLTGTNTVMSSDTAYSTVFGSVTLDSPNSFVVEDLGGGTVQSPEYPLNGTGLLMAVSGMDVSTFDKAQKTLAIVDSALVHVVGEMARYGALQARFESTISNLEVTAENTTNSRSRIQDADYAQETAALSRALILQQAGTSMLAQANQLPQSVLGLLQ